MIVFLETNYVVELVFEQEQIASCERLLRLAESGDISLHLPAYCFVEPYETLRRRHNARGDLRKALAGELLQLGRSSGLAAQVAAATESMSVLVESIDREAKRTEEIRTRLLSAATVIPLSRAILDEAALARARFDLSPQDSVVYASVLSALPSDSESPSCFVSRDSKAFYDPDIRSELEARRCKYLSRFDTACDYIEAMIRKGSA